MVISVASQKGGTGKTSTSVSLAAGLAHKGKRVLLIDIDSQANSSKVLLRHYAEPSGPRWPQEEVKALSHELIDAYERLFAYDEALVRLGELLAAEPILVPSGQERPRVRLRYITHPQRSYQDVQNELAVQLANLPRFTAYVSIHGEQHQIKLSPPLVAEIDEARIHRIRTASKARFGRPPRAPVPPVATAPTPTPHHHRLPDASPAIIRARSNPRAAPVPRSGFLQESYLALGIFSSMNGRVVT